MRMIATDRVRHDIVLDWLVLTPDFCWARCIATAFGIGYCRYCPGSLHQRRSDFRPSLFVVVVLRVAAALVVGSPAGHRTASRSQDYDTIAKLACSPSFLVAGVCEALL